jgi:hypothetical protein
MYPDQQNQNQIPQQPMMQGANIPVSGNVTPALSSGAQPATKSNPNSTQNLLHIAEIRDGVVIMNDGSFRSVLMCRSINFDLMSPEEREGVEYAYQSFLNSLYFELQNPCSFYKSRHTPLPRKA